MTMTVYWRRVLECVDPAVPRRAAEIYQKYRDTWLIGTSTAWITNHGMPSFEQNGYVARVPGSRPRQWIRTSAGTAAIEKALNALHEAAKSKLLEDFKAHGAIPFFPDDSSSYTYEAQQEAIRLGWLAVARPSLPQVTITDAGRAELPSF